jgi:AraC family transcriptional regulator
LTVSRWECRIRETGGRGTLQHGRFVLKFVHTGAFRAQLPSGAVVVDATRALLAAPHEPIEVTKQFGPVVTGSAIAISASMMAKLLPHWSGHTSLLRVEITPRAVLMQHLILRQIAARASDDAVRELIVALVLEAFRAPRVVPIVTRRQTLEPRRDIVEMAQALLTANYDRPVHLDDIARAVDISPFHLCRAFKRVTGVHMREYITRLRLRAALGEVIDPNSSIAAIAQEHGFSSHSHFAASFRKEFQITPSELRQLATVPIGDLRIAFGRLMTDW